MLLFQGPSSLFFRDLGRALKRRGAEVARIGFAPGDRLYWSRDAGAYIRCAVSPGAFPDWIRDRLARLRPTDLVMLGDGRFYHRETLAAASTLAEPPRRHVIEHGLIRPGWLLVEPSGTGTESAIPAEFATSAPVSPPPATRAKGAGFAQYAALDIGYNAANVALGWAYNRHYVRHTVDGPIREYAGWLGKLMRRPVSAAKDRQAGATVADWPAGARIFILPLQLETDFQIRAHGRGMTMAEHLAAVLESFAAHAPGDACLIVKRHPLDNGHASWRRQIAQLCARLSLTGRVVYFDRGDLDAMLSRASGVVTVNSTVGLTAILAGVPCKVLGVAVYDLAGLTDPGPLDGFWRTPRAPSPDAAARFRDMLLDRFHVPGAFDGPGARIGAEALAARICA